MLEPEFLTWPSFSHFHSIKCDFQYTYKGPYIGNQISSLNPFMTSFLQEMKLFKTFKGDASGRILDIMCFYSKVYSGSEKTFLETLQPGQIWETQVQNSLGLEHSNDNLRC
jgi:hypothetical protein